MSLLLRPAVPSRTDARAFAVLADQAAHGKFRTLLGSAAGRFLENVFPERGHDLSYEHVTFAEIDGTIVGMVGAYSGEVHRRHAANTRRLIVRHVGLRLPRMLYVYLIGRPVFSFMDHVDPGDYYVQTLAVAPEHRRRGVGTQLLEAAEGRAGGGRIVLDVATDNTGAIAMYESRGWKIIDTSAHSGRALGAQRVHRLAKDGAGAR